MAAFDEDRPEVDGGAGTDVEDGGGGGGGGEARDIAAVRASAGRGVFYVESKPSQVQKKLLLLFTWNACEERTNATKRVVYERTK